MRNSRNDDHPPQASKAQDGGGQDRKDARQAVDAALLHRFQQGDPLAAADFFDRYQGDVNRIIWHILGADPDHDDLVQQTFLQMIRALQRSSQVTNLRAWVRMTAVNTVRSELRRRARQRRREQNVERMVMPDTHPVDYESRRLLTRSYSLLERLGEEDRIAFVLRHIEGYKLQEAADACNCSLATIKRRLAKAQEQFMDMARQDPVLAEWLSKEKS